MQNNNSLIALAYIKISDNPLEVFCNFISYSLYIAENKSLRLDELSIKIENEFGLKLPIKIIETSSAFLINKGIIELLPNGAGYKLIQEHFDYQTFVYTRQSLKDKEFALLQDMSKYLENLNASWDIDKLRILLSNFLFRHENAFNLFINSSIEINTDDSKVEPDWYISKYISHLIDAKNNYYDYLVEVVNGIMIYIGIYEDSQEKTENNIQGTTFYLDTRLLLRLLGFSWDAAVKATIELVQMIQQNYQCEISYFEHTLIETQNALMSAADNLKNADKIENVEIRAHRRNSRFDANDYNIAAKSIKKRLEKEFNCHKQLDFDWDRVFVRRNNINWEELTDYIKSKHPSWNERAIHNDVASINYINILRDGKYGVKYGGKDKLPIFVTTNIPFIKNVKDFIFLMKDSSQKVSWNTKSLPVISESVLVSRLWLPIAKLHSNLPVLTLTRNTYSALQLNARFYEQLKNVITDIKEKHKYNIIDIPEERQSKLEELITKNAHGNIDNINAEIVALSFEELVGIESEKDKDIIKNLEVNLFNKDKKVYDFIEMYSLQFLTGFNLSQIYLLTGKYWWILSSILIVAVSSINVFFTEISSKDIWIINIISFCIPYGLKILDRFTNHSKVCKWINDFAIKRAINSCCKSIEKQLIKEGKSQYIEEVKKFCTVYINNKKL